MDIVGEWLTGTGGGGTVIGSSFLQDDDTGKSEKYVAFHVSVVESGNYSVEISYTTSASRANNVPVSIVHACGVDTITVDQQQPTAADGFLQIGSFFFSNASGAEVRISNNGTSGKVIADAVRLTCIGTGSSGSGGSGGPAQPTTSPTPQPTTPITPSPSPSPTLAPTDAVCPAATDIVVDSEDGFSSGTIVIGEWTESSAPGSTFIGASFLTDNGTPSTKGQLFVVFNPAVPVDGWFGALV